MMDPLVDDSTRSPFFLGEKVPLLLSLDDDDDDTDNWTSQSLCCAT